MSVTSVVVVVSFSFVVIFLRMLFPPVSMSSDVVTSFEKVLVDEALFHKHYL